MSKEEIIGFMPIQNNTAKTPERIYRNKDSNTEPMPIPRENNNRSASVPLFPNVKGEMTSFKNSKDYERNAKTEQRYANLILREKILEGELNKKSQRSLSTDDLPNSVFKLPNSVFKLPTPSQIKKINTNIKSGLTLNMDKQKEENVEREEMKTMKTEDTNIKGGKTRKSTKSKNKKTKKKKPKFLYNPNDPKKSFDVYIDKNPDDTITIKYTTVDDVKNTIQKLEKLYKNNKYSHKRIWQVGMIMKVRLEAMLNNKHLYPNAKHVKQRYDLSKKYFIFLGKRSQEKDEIKRKKMIFNV